MTSNLLTMIKNGVRSCVCIFLCYSTSNAAPSNYAYYTVQIDQIGPKLLDMVKNHPDIAWWVEANDKLFVKARPRFNTYLAKDFAISKIALKIDPPNLAIVVGASTADIRKIGATVVVTGGRSALVELPKSRSMESLSTQDPRDFKSIPERNIETALKPDLLWPHHVQILPFRKNTVLSAQLANQFNPKPVSTATPNQIADALDKIDLGRWQADVKELVGIPRYALNPQGIEQIKAWLIIKFSNLPNVAVSVQDFAINSKKGFNVIGSMGQIHTQGPIYIVGAHYDSISEIPETNAPGAEDNASGIAALMEIARIMSTIPLNGSLLFIAFGGEEQGLFGSQAYVESLINRQLQERIAGVLVMDMIAYSNDKIFDILLETSKTQDPMLEVLFNLARQYTTLQVSRSYNYWGSDHVPFLDKNMPAVLFIDNDYQDYPHTHRSTDTIDQLSPPQAKEVIKLHLAALIHWLIRPPSDENVKGSLINRQEPKLGSRAKSQ